MAQANVVALTQNVLSVPLAKMVVSRAEHHKKLVVVWDVKRPAKQRVRIVNRHAKEIVSLAAKGVARVRIGQAIGHGLLQWYLEVLLLSIIIPQHI